MTTEQLRAALAPHGITAYERTEGWYVLEDGTATYDGHAEGEQPQPTEHAALQQALDALFLGHGF